MRLLFIFIAFFLTACLPNDSEKKVEFETKSIEIIRENKVIQKFSVEIADTDDKRQRGLMYRTKMPDTHGMLFLFPSSKYITMWMANTPMSLDMIFIDKSDSIVDIQENATPFSHDVIKSRKKANQVLEVKSGISRDFDIKIGDKIKKLF